ncbi:MAG: S-layer homology domain-containing protein [Clostridia bacterium]|nr:S-layer homology domain-containing protein [Clostridia bacterium]
MYTDVDGDFWAYDAIKYSTDRQWFSGYSDGNFLPDKLITRAEAAKVLAVYEYRNREYPSISSFTDVSIDMWYAPYIEATDDLFPNVSPGCAFRPNDFMTREDTVYAIVNAARLNNKVKYVDVSVVDSFCDSSTVEQLLKPYIAIGIQTSLISGYSDGTFCPKKPLTRAEFATLLYRAANISKLD